MVRLGSSAVPPGCSVRQEVVTPSVPFGGYGASGPGRDDGIAAIDEYTDNKSGWAERTGGTRDRFVLG